MQDRKDKTSLLCNLGVTDQALCVILKLGNNRFKNERSRPDLSWQDIFRIMGEKHFPQKDRTWVAFESAISFLERQTIEVPYAMKSCGG